MKIWLLSMKRVSTIHFCSFLLKQIEDSINTYWWVVFFSYFFGFYLDYSNRVGRGNTNLRIMLYSRFFFFFCFDNQFMGFEDGGMNVEAGLKRKCVDFQGSGLGVALMDFCIFKRGWSLILSNFSNFWKPICSETKAQTFTISL